MSPRFLFYCSTLLLLAGCASPPRQELMSARSAVAQAYAVGAHQLAPEEYEKASSTLREGEDLFREGRYRKAREVLPEAEKSAFIAMARAREEQALMEQRRKEGKVEAPRPSAARPKKPSPALPVGKPAPPSPPQPAPEPAPSSPSVPAPAPLAPTYTVGEGENLWTIAARRSVYGDALLWPLIYKANRDQIKDPRQIFPGQMLSIPREVTEQEKEEAREKARASEIFPLEILLKHRPEDGR